MFNIKRDKSVNQGNKPHFLKKKNVYWQYLHHKQKNKWLDIITLIIIFFFVFLNNYLHNYLKII